MVQKVTFNMNKNHLYSIFNQEAMRRRADNASTHEMVMTSNGHMVRIIVGVKEDVFFLMLIELEFKRRARQKAEMTGENKKRKKKHRQHAELYYMWYFVLKHNQEDKRKSTQNVQEAHHSVQIRPMLFNPSTIISIIGQEWQWRIKQTSYF